MIEISRLFFCAYTKLHHGKRMNTQPHHQDNIFKGIICGILAFFLFATMNAAGKMLGDNHHALEISFWRCSIAVIPFLLFMTARREFSLLTVQKPWTLLARVIVGNLSLVATFAAVKYLPLSNATILFMTAALITPAIAFFVLKENIGIKRWSAILIGFIGVIIVANPSAIDANTRYMIGVALALAGAIGYSIIHILLRQMKEEKSFTVTLYFLLSGTVMFGIAMPFISVPVETTTQIIAILIVGISGALAQLFLTMAFKYAPASSIAPFNMTGLLFASIFDAFIWNYIPGIPVFTGAFIIISSTLYIIHRERIAKVEMNNG